MKNGVLFTPPATAAILPGITRDTIATLARDLGYEVREQALPARRSTWRTRSS